ncbi:putative Mechanosensitive ion channel domain-containing protein [Tripterygium wilfordii]|uniref:Mechanosensitive ion channel protein n=1 Tax=Tripterygium wilfordii TaxID=458696 RepID=A0A7J7CZ05_TRIWF|nr:mechanosensitive ion channel protein 5-like [Tripterygium wilfordii]XP_038717392.1 mechanosensitive ion channel protein 5-like [Tripterygium wilfordii]KAF5739314.1 putative Mechanosensitive ion channel domain-containing protein [Tripterygium wilfordii]
MELFREALKTQRCSAKQEEKQALLHDQKDYHMAQPSDLEGQKEVVVKIDRHNVSSKETETAFESNFGESTSTKVPGSSKRSKVSFEEVLDEAVRCTGKDFSSGESVQQHSLWNTLARKTKSRLIDPPEEQYEGCQRFVDSGEGDDIEDPEESKKLNFSALTALQLASLVMIITALVCSLSVAAIRSQTLWHLPLWKWELMIFTIICGRLVIGWGIRVVVACIERNFLLRERVLYFVYGLKRAVQNCFWLGLVLLVWHWIFDEKVEEETKSKVLPYVTKILVCLWMAAFIWLFKTFLVKTMASSFHVNTFFERIREALFSQYIIETLSGPRLLARHGEEQEEEGSNPDLRRLQSDGVTTHRNHQTTLLQRSATAGKSHRVSRAMSKKRLDEEIYIGRLHKMNQKNISAWNMRRMMNIIRHGALSTLDEQILKSDIKDESAFHIKSEFQAKEAAKKIFHNVAKPGSNCISLDDVMCFMGYEEALRAMSLFGAVRLNEEISKSALNNWIVNAFKERRALALSLNDTKTAVDELHNMLNIFVALVIVIISLVILGIPITHFLVFISSQLLLVVFIFGNTCKTVFEAIIFLFIMHPFDVDDRVEIDGVQMVVEEMNILTTLFLRHDHQKVIYPNTVLATKPIGNFHRSPDMGEAVNFCIHISTPMEKIAHMRERIKDYAEDNSHHWHPSPMVVVNDIEDMNKLKISVYLTHRMSYQHMMERYARRGLVIEALIKVFRDLDIEYRLLPLDVNVQNMQPLVSNRRPSTWTTQANK